MKLTKQKVYKVPFTRSDYGYVTVTASSIDEAEDIVSTGNYTDDMMTVKGGDTIVDGQIEEIF